MNKYREFLPELKSTTLFQNIPDEELLALLEVMNPEIVCKKAGEPGNPGPDIEKGIFAVGLKGVPLDQLAERPDVYDMPKFMEPGMMMAEIPVLSEMLKSKAPKPKKMRFPPFRPPKKEFEYYMLRMSADMITKYYGEEFVSAQNTMLRNFLGILAQKVTDIRKEKAQMEDRYLEELAPYRLHVFHAGVAMKIVKDAISKWNELHPELPAAATPGGSVNLIRDCLDGEPCDVLISADDGIIESMMIPETAESYEIWAGNSMVIAGNGINSGNWKEKLLEDGATFGHHDPYGDPGGYRAVMAMKLADRVEPGLGEKLMTSPGHKGMEKRKPFPGPMGKKPDYEFTYRSGAESRGIDFAELPKCMDLSDPEQAEVYAEAEFEIDENTKVRGAPIAHAITVPKTALHKEAAQEFVKLFMEMDVEKYGFIKR